MCNCTQQNNTPSQPTTYSPPPNIVRTVPILTPYIPTPPVPTQPEKPSLAELETEMRNTEIAVLLLQEQVTKMRERASRARAAYIEEATHRAPGFASRAAVSLQC